MSPRSVSRAESLVALLVALLAFGRVCLPRAQGEAACEAAAASPPKARAVPPAAYDAFGKAVLARLRGDKRAALDFLKQALSHDPDSVTLLQEIGDHYLEAGETSKAADSYRKALDKDPDDFKSNLEIGQIYFRARRSGPAIRHLEKAAAQQPGHLRTAFLLASLYQVNKRYPDCARQYEAILRLHPGLVRTSDELAKVYGQIPADIPALKEAADKAGETDFIPHFRLGQALLDKKDLDGAAKTIERATQIEPKWIAGYETLGRLYQAQGRLDDAVRAYSQAAESHPPSLEHLYAISTALFDGKDYARTVKVLERIRAVRPNHPDALFRLAACHYALGQPRKVIEAGELYVESAADEIDCAIYRLLGFSYAETGQKAKAYECAVQLVIAVENARNGADYAFLSRQAAQVLAAAEDRPEAIRVLEDAARHAPKDPDVLLDLAVLYEEEKADDKTEATLKGVLQRDPTNHRALNHLGYFYAERGRKLQEAVSLIRDALKAEPKNWAYLDSLGWACFKLGRYPEALEKLQEAITIQDDPVLREHLGSVFEAAGNKEKAREHWLRALELDPKRETLRNRINKLNETAGQASP